MKTVVVFLSLFSVVCFAQVQDELKKDHPLIQPYPGSTRVFSHRENYEQLKIPLDFGGLYLYSHSLIAVEGTITTFVYNGPDGRSVLEVFRNYTDALSKAGFVAIPKQEGKERDDNHTPLEEFRLPYGFCDDTSSNSRNYFAGRKIVEGKAAYAVIYSTKCHGSDPTYDGLRTIVILVEPRQMETGKVVVGAVKMSNDIRETGHTVLQGIEFDFNSTTIRKESEPALKQVVQLLGTQKDLRLYVVGHTDMIGSPESNLKLAQGRAASVVSWLEKNGVAKNRLIPQGVGFLAPKSDNRSDAGKAQNRRVELIEIVGK